MLKQELDNKIKNTPLQTVIKKLDYNSERKLKKSLDKFINCESINKWLNSGFYDLVYNAENFLIDICNLFKIDKEILSYEIKKVNQLKKENERFKNSYIFINTNFKRKSEPIFALALCESKRRISLYKNEKYLFKSIDEILNIVSKQIINHYINSSGKLGIWGEIENYQLHLFDNIYTFDLKGKLLNLKENFDINLASLKIKK